MRNILYCVMLIMLLPSLPVFCKEIEVIHPKGGEKLKAGSITAIVWEMTEDTDLYNIDLSIDNGRSWRRIANKVKGNSYDWQVPEQISDSAFIRVKGYFGEECESYVIPFVEGIGFRNKFTKVDREGNIYVAGEFSGAVIRGKELLMTGDMKASDIFVLKFDKNMNLLWKNVISSLNGEDTLFGMDMDLEGNISLNYQLEKQGYFNNETMLSEGSGMMRIGSDGALIYSRSLKGFAGRKYNALSCNIAVDKESNLYMVGTFRDKIDIDGIALKSEDPEYGNLLAKFNSHGEAAWVVPICSEYRLVEVITDSSGAVYIAGYLAIDSVCGVALTERFENEWVHFVMKYDKNGLYEWTNYISGNGYDISGNGIEEVVDIYTEHGALYISGNFGDSVCMWNMCLNTIDQYDDDHTYLAKILLDGNLVWMKKTYGYTSFEGIRDIMADKTGNIYTAGTFYDAFFFKNRRIKSNSSYDMYMAQYDTNMNIKEFHNGGSYFGGWGDDYIDKIFMDDLGNLLMVGRTAELAVFGDILYKTESNWDENILWKLGRNDRYAAISEKPFYIQAPYLASADLHFGKVHAGTTKDTLVEDFIKNTGEVQLTILSVKIEGHDASAFSILQNIKGGVLEPDETLPVSFSFSPLKEGRYYAQIVIVHSKGKETRYDITGGVDFHPQKLSMAFPAEDDVLVAGSNVMLNWTPFYSKEKLLLEFHLMNYMGTPPTYDTLEGFEWKVPAFNASRCKFIIRKLGKQYAEGHEALGYRGVKKAVHSLYDNGGCLYEGGVFTGDIIWDNKIYTSKGGKDIFLVKYNHVGKIVWVTTVGGQGNDSLAGMIIGKDGGICLHGSFFSEMRFGDFTLRKSSASANFIAELDSMGEIRWVTGMEKYRYDGMLISSFAYDDHGNVFLTAEVNGVVKIDNTLFYMYATVLMKLNGAGQLIWVRGYDTYDRTEKDMVFPDHDGNVFLIYGVEPAYNNSQFRIRKYDGKGNFLFNNQFDIELLPEYLHREVHEAMGNSFDKDTSGIFSIIMPRYDLKGVDLGRVCMDADKDTVVKDFIVNKLSYPLRIDSIYIEGRDSDSFEILGGEYPFILDGYGNYDLHLKIEAGKSQPNYYANIKVITQADKGGTYSYALQDICAGLDIAGENSNELQAYVNGDFLSVDIEPLGTGEHSLILYGADGMQAKHAGNISLISGVRHEAYIDLSNLSSGIYFLVLESGSMSRTLPVRIVR